MLLLKEPPYPVGGLQGGHLVALTTLNRSTYSLSVHYGPRAGPPEQQEAALLEAFRTMLK